MGNSTSVCLDDYLNDLTTSFPTLEQNIEAAFNTCTQDGENEECMRYEVVEPVIRHLLFVVGYGEQFLHITKPDGTLKTELLDPIFKRAGFAINYSKPLFLDDWKLLTLAWIRCIQEIQRDQLTQWETALAEAQADQQHKYEQALDLFKESYIKQIAAYQESVQKEIDEEFEYRKQYIEQASVQQKYKQSQQEYIDQLNAHCQASMQARREQAKRRDYIDLIDREVHKFPVTPMKGATKSYCYMYPSSINHTKAPVSGGCGVLRVTRHARA